MAAEEADRSTPDRALRAYFRHRNNESEVFCLRNELAKAVSGIGDYPLDAFDRFSESIRDSFFTGLAGRVVAQFSNRESFAACMARRQSYSYTVTSVETPAPDRTRFETVVTNTTPIAPDAVSDPIMLGMRAEGMRYRYEFLRVGRDWRIAQIEESYSASEQWRTVFNDSDLRPSIPTLILPY